MKIVMTKKVEFLIFELKNTICKELVRLLESLLKFLNFVFLRIKLKNAVNNLSIPSSKK